MCLATSPTALGIRLAVTTSTEQASRIRCSVCFETLGAANADKAVELIEAGNQPRFLFVDVVMPGSMDGREFASWAQKRLPRAEILLTTGYSEENERTDSPFPILSKPYRVEELSAYLSARFGDAEDVSQKAG